MRTSPSSVAREECRGAGGTEPTLAGTGLPESALARLQALGLRRTRATVSVLALFAADARWSASHADVEQALRARGVAVNRVTLYRLLDRLAQAGVLRREADAVSRVWRFSLASLDGSGGAPVQPTEAGQAAVVPWFECDACHRQFEIEAVGDGGPPAQAVAQELLQALASLGHHGLRVDLAVHGTCAGCAQPRV